MNNSKLIKSTTFFFAAILGLWIVYSLFSRAGMRYSMNTGGYFGGGHMYMNFGSGYGSIITYLLLLLVKAAVIIFVVAFLAALVVWIKNNIFTKEDIETIKRTFAGSGSSREKAVCSVCGKDMAPEWNVCPYCGIPKAKKEETQK